MNRMRVAINQSDQPVLTTGTDHGAATLSAQMVGSTISGPNPKNTGQLSDQHTANFEDDYQQNSNNEGMATGVMKINSS